MENFVTVARVGRDEIPSAMGDGPPAVVSVAPYQPWVAGAFRWRLGLRPLDLDDWIEIGDDYAEQMAAKADARTCHPDTVLVAMDEAVAACREVLDALVVHLVGRRPDAFAHIGGAVINHRTGERLHLDGPLHPLDIAGRLVQEDLVVMVPVDGRLVFAAGSVCSPNRWDLRSKLGRPLAEVHAPVSRLNDQLVDPIDKALERLTPTRSFWRLGWGLLDTPALYQPVDGTAPAPPTVVTADDVHVRVERETLRRFPNTACVLFTIRTHITRLTDVAADPEAARRLREAVAAMPDDVRDYKRLDRIDAVLAEVLADVTSRPVSPPSS